jgi:hypothetical protein
VPLKAIAGRGMAMGRDWKETTSYTLTSKQVERMLTDDFGDKLHPVDDAKMAEQRRQRARHQEEK